MCSTYRVAPERYPSRGHLSLTVERTTGWVNGTHILKARVWANNRHERSRLCRPLLTDSLEKVTHATTVFGRRLGFKIPTNVDNEAMLRVSCDIDLDQESNFST